MSEHAPQFQEKNAPYENKISKSRTGFNAGQQEFLWIFILENELGLTSKLIRSTKDISKPSRLHNFGHPKTDKPVEKKFFNFNFYFQYSQ